VIEVVQPPYSGNFIINGRRFTAKSAACFNWVAGERIKLLDGDWKWPCVSRRHSQCLAALDLRDMVPKVGPWTWW
jgi:hypothetical protein